MSGKQDSQGIPPSVHPSSSAGAPHSRPAGPDHFNSARWILVGFGIVSLIFHLLSLSLIGEGGRNEITLGILRLVSALSLAAGVILSLRRVGNIPGITAAVIVGSLLMAGSQSVGLLEDVPALETFPFIGKKGYLYYNHTDDLLLYIGLGLLVLTGFFAILDAMRARQELLFQSQLKDRALGDLREVESALRESETRYRSLVDYCPFAIVVHQDGKILYSNQAGFHLIGATDPSQVLEHSLYEFLAPEHHEQIQSFWSSMVKKARQGDPLERTPFTERRLIRLDGGNLFVHSAGIPIDFQGRPAVLVVLIDISDQKRMEVEKEDLEAQLRQSQKMEALGTLAGGIAHDFNNLLTGILGYAEILKLEAPPESSTERAAGVIEQAAMRAAELTRQLLGFARKGKLQNTSVDLHDSVREVISLVQRTINKNIRIVEQLSGNRPKVIGDPTQLQQVILNLALNARDAMPQRGGEIIFTTEEVHFTGEEAAFEGKVKAGDYVLLSVADTGNGIPPEVIDRIFEPFFTTKEQGKGTGMGLAMVYGIVENHGGVIRVSSEIGRGTTFRLYFPLARGEAAILREAPKSTKAIPGQGRILLVDDEEVVRQLGSDMLKKLGYEVILARDGIEAVALFKVEEISLAIIDMVMPGMGGQECFRMLRSIDPSVRAVLSTGYDRDGVAAQILEEGMAGFVQKPYSTSELSEVVAEALRR